MKYDVTKLSITYPKYFVKDNKVIFSIYRKTKNNKKLSKYTGTISKSPYSNKYFMLKLLESLNEH